MRRFIVGIGCLISLAILIGRVGAADEAGHPVSAEKAEPVKVRAEGHFEGGKGEKEYDLSTKKGRDEFSKDAEENRIHELEQVQAPEIIPKKFDLGIWSIVVFLVLLGVLTKFAWKPMIEGLRKREENIRGALEQAEKTRQEAMELQNRLDAKMKAAGADIARMMDEARREAQGLKEEFLADARKDIQQERDRLRREIDTAKDQALQEIWQQSVKLASIMSAKAVRRSLSEDDHRRLLDESLKELQQAGGGFAKRSVAGAGL